MSWLTLAAAFIKPLINAATKLHHTKELTRVEGEAPIEDNETHLNSNTTGVPDRSNFVDFYEHLQAIRHKMGLDSNLTLTLHSVLDANSTQTQAFLVRVITTASRTTSFVNFLYLWLIIMIVCIGILGSIAIYENAPNYVKKIQGSIMRHKRPLTKWKDI